MENHVISVTQFILNVYNLTKTIINHLQSYIIIIYFIYNHGIYNTKIIDNYIYNIPVCNKIFQLLMFSISKQK